MRAEVEPHRRKEGSADWEADPWHCRQAAHQQGLSPSRDQGDANGWPSRSGAAHLRAGLLGTGTRHYVSSWAEPGTGQGKHGSSGTR